MRNQLLVSTALLVLAACASPTRAPHVAPPAPTSAAPVIKVHDVRDIVSPPGDPQDVSHLADQVREMVVFIHGGEDPGATVTANGSAIVVVATPQMQRKVSDYLLRRRENVRPDGL
jgi:hypothetical protein